MSTDVGPWTDYSAVGSHSRVICGEFRRDIAVVSVEAGASAMFGDPHGA